MQNSTSSSSSSSTLTWRRRQTSYIYGRNHIAYKNTRKIGRASNLLDRDLPYATGELDRGAFEFVIEFPSLFTAKYVENLIHYEFERLHIKDNTGGNEFYHESILEFIEPYLTGIGIEFKRLTEMEIADALARENRVKKLNVICNTLKCKRLPNMTMFIRRLKSNKERIVSLKNAMGSTKSIIQCRPYQTEFIEAGIQMLRQTGRVYLELATGAGKSVIVYNLLHQLHAHAETIVILSPRKIINKQNVKSDYLQLIGGQLDGQHKVFNVSGNNMEELDAFLKVPGKKLITVCTQSADKLYDAIMNNNICNIVPWFDEAHWAVEKWCKLTDIKKQFWLKDTEKIKYRIFTSASPNKQLILENRPIFGDLYSPIKVKELVDLKWLCTIKPFVYEMMDENANLLKSMFANFEENGRHYGFSFHNTQQNAFNMFYSHYEKYVAQETTIKPFLLVGDSFTSDKEPRIKVVDLACAYDYRNINTYEETPNSIGYVVAQYNMGYDFNQLDFICISDPKFSQQDIIQSIGRGMRPDKLGENGSNASKYLVLLLPVFVDQDKETKYERVTDVLHYLLHDIEIPLQTIEFNYSYSSGAVSGRSEQYGGEESIKTILLNLMRIDAGRKLNLADLLAILKKNDIHSNVEYHKYREYRSELGLPELPQVTFPDLVWIDTYTDEDKSKFYTKIECIQKIQQIKNDMNDADESWFGQLDDDDKKIKWLHNTDAKIPINCLWAFYGGIRSEFSLD